ncbi:MAG: GntR family transcriptional regulator [Pseudomonadota bacterium]
MHDKLSQFEDPRLRPAPHYVEIERILAAAIQGGALGEGTVLTEGKVAALFGTSRTPVRTAFAQLLQGGLVARFDGRGFVVSGPTGAAPTRVRLTRAMLGLDPAQAAEPRPGSAELIERAFEQSLTDALPFGLFRINEQLAADHFGVSRNIVRDLLARFQDRGVVRKDRRSHWVVGPLTARDVAHFFVVRSKLEPLALLDSVPHVPLDEIMRMRQELDAAMSGDRPLDAAGFDELEIDIHVRLLSRSTNPHLLRMVRQTQLAFVVNDAFARQVGTHPFEIALREHAIVLDFVMRGSVEAAAQCLEEHIRLSAERTRQRLIALSVFPEPDLPGYLQKQ